MKRALITGITGQDGRYMAELLAGKGYQVFGLVRGQANPKAQMIQDENPALELVEGDLQDLSSLIAAVEQVQPDEVYNLGAISLVQLSFKQPELTADITGLGVLRMLEAIRVVGGADNNPIRFYQASSSEMFGKVRETPQNEDTPFHPRSPYGAAKVFGHYTTVNYREAYGLHANSGICFNHESPRRGLEFVTRKVTNSMARIKLGLQEKITLGNLDSSRDWGYAGDYVDAMWRMLQQPEPGDFVIAMGETHTNRELLDVAAGVAGFDDWRPLVQQDERFMRPAGRHPHRRRRQGAAAARLAAPRHLRGARADDVRERPQGRAGPRRRRPAVGLRNRRQSSMSAALRAATSTGSHTGENGGAYDRSRLATSSTGMWFQIAVAITSMRFAAPSAPTICAPTMRPSRRSATTFTLIGAASG